MSLNETLKKIRRIHLKLETISKELLAGMYKSVFKGRGMEFEEVREYMPGDDIRTIDWNVTARLNTPYVKSFREERELTVILLVDVSASLLYGEKNELVAEIGAVLAFSAIKNHDKIGLILFSDKVEKYIQPNKGTQHVLRIIRELLIFKPTHQRTNIGAALAFLGKVQTKSCVCFLLSDFINDGYEKELKIITKRHDLIAVRVYDPREKEFPDLGLLTVQDLETGQNTIIDTSTQSFRDHFNKTTQERFNQTEKLIKKMGAGWIDVRTDESYIEAILKYFKTRLRK